MSSKRFAGEVIWGSCALGFIETCFGFCVFAPRETHIQKKAKIDPQEIEAQPLEEVKEESSQNCSDSEDSSSSQSSSTAEAGD